MLPYYVRGRLPFVVNVWLFHPTLTSIWTTINLLNTWNWPKEKNHCQLLDFFFMRISFVKCYNMKIIDLIPLSVHNSSTNSLFPLVDKIEEVEQGMSPSDDAKEFMAWMKSTLSKYWILFCCFAFLLVALQNEVSLYQIFYMVIFLMVFIIYQVCIR